MRCNACGREEADNTLFCSHCGNRFGATYGSQGAHPSKTNPDHKNTVVIVVVVVVLAIVIGGAALTFAILGDVAEEVAKPNVEMTVLSVTGDVDTLWPPNSGMKYAQVTVLFKNNGDSSKSLSFVDFNIQTSDGARYGSTLWVDDTIPDGVAPGGTATFTICFEIPTTSSPSLLVYSELFADEVMAVVPA